jgi:hypothetical protein
LRPKYLMNLHFLKFPKNHLKRMYPKNLTFLKNLLTHLNLRYHLYRLNLTFLMSL